MKRIYILAWIALAITSNVVFARHYTSPRDRVHYSPYAFDFDHCGLVPGCVEYNPYAFDRDHSGLVSETMDYTPYAFSFEHNGLINTEVCCLGSRMAPCNTSSVRENQRLARSIDGLADSIKDMAIQKGGAWQAPRSLAPTYNTPPSRANCRGTDPWYLVRDYLNEVIPGQYRLTRTLKIDQDTLSFDIVLKDRDLIIKYWNPTGILALQQTSGYKEKILSKYMASWASFEVERDAAGFRTHHIISSDMGQVLEELANYLEYETM